MKTTVKKTYRKRRRYTSKAAFNYIASHYYKAKLSTSLRIKLDTNECLFLPNNANTYKISELISQCPDWGAMKKMFQSYKLTGIAVTISPIPTSSQSVDVQTITGTFPVMYHNIVSAPVFGIVTIYDDTSYNNIIESDKSIILNFTNTIRKYWPFRVADWVSSINTNQEAGPQFAVNVQGLNSNGESRWQVKIDFYITYRNRA